MNENRNMVLAIVLSGLVLLGWQYYFAVPQMEKQKEAARLQQQTQTQTTAPAPATDGKPTPSPATPGTPPQSGSAQPASLSRTQALAASPRIKIDTPFIKGSIALKGARIDDVELATYHETVDPKSPSIVLLSPSGGPHPLYAEFGWVNGAGGNIKLPDTDTLWTAASPGPLTPERPLTLTWDNGEGIVFKRTIAIDNRYMFTVTASVENKSDKPVTLYQYGLVSRHGLPHIQGYYLLHEGPVGVLGDGKLYEPAYKDTEKPMDPVKSQGGWLGITDKYWAAAVIPDQTASTMMKFSSHNLGTVRSYQADFLRDAITIAPGASADTKSQLFAGAKEVSVVDGYEKDLGIRRFDLLIDWGWFYFITKPLFKVIDFFYRYFGNFGIAILLVTVLIKLIFFPLANKSYASMAKMKMIQPKMQELKEKYPDDRAKQQQELMELYKKEKINPLAGCLPIVVQIPVFFALYKVLFVTIEMRHAPFYGWIKDLSAPDPTNLFNLFGLIPFDPTTLPVLGYYLHLGVWPIVMGITMWVQMKMNPTPPDPTQKMIFAWMPLIFTFMLAGFSAGLVIYWAWNNTLSVLQQGVIMKKNGVKIELFDNVKAMFGKKTPAN
ncbi:MAG TPA: membrane protein insertase YidC [Xanthobacteraceae bacterium]|nr:membrane protein insertase YidC [Xanthobacteraceae bacterium]